MTLNNDDSKRSCLDDEQKFNANQLIGSGWAIPDVARHYGRVDLPQWQSEAVQERQQTRFDMGGK